MRKEAPTDEDLASYEGRYPKDLFNKSVVANDQAIGHVAKETDDVIVVFGDSDNSRYDVPKSKISVAGGSVVVNEQIEQFAVDRDSPLPEGKSLRPSAAEIREVAGRVVEEDPARDERSDVELKAEKIVDEVKELVGGELKRAGRSVERALWDLGVTVSNADLKKPVERAADEAKRAAKSGAGATRDRIAAAQNMAEAGLSAEAALKVEKESKRRSTDELDLASYEGKYPKDLFKKTVTLNNQIIGHVAKETDDVIVVFSEDDSSIRFDIPKSEVTLSGGSVVVTEDLLFRYRARRDAPMPRDKSMRPSADQIRKSASRQKQQERAAKPTTPDRVVQEGQQLAIAPRPATTLVSRPTTYVDTETEISKKMKRAAKELRDVIVAGSKVAKKRAKEAKERAEAKQAEMDAQAISRMGELSGRFANSFEDVLSEIRTRNYAEQEHIYTGFLKLMDYQRELVLARRDLASRLKNSVNKPVVSREDINRPPRRRLKSPPQLPEDVGEPAKRRTTRGTSSAA